jgi:hypothetical protein
MPVKTGIFPLICRRPPSDSTPPKKTGSSLFSVELDLGKAKLAGDEVKHGGEVSR